MLNDVLYIFKTNNEWIILKDNNFSFKEIGKKGTIHCNFQSINITKYENRGELQQLFIEIPSIQKIFFFSSFQYTGLQQLVDIIQALKIKNRHQFGKKNS